MSYAVLAKALGYGLLGIIGVVTLTYEIVKTRRKNEERYSNNCTVSDLERPQHHCEICLKRTEKSEEVRLPCQHTFCLKCLGSLLSGTQTTCCVCRKEIPVALRSQICLKFESRNI